MNSCRSPITRSRGFTLIEIMVVVVIMGMMVTFVMFAIDDPADEQLKIAMRRIQHSMRLAHEEAELNQEEVAIKFSRDGYQFQYLDEDKKWQPVDKPHFMLPHKLADQYELKLLHEGVSVSLTAMDTDDEKDKEKNQGRIYLASSGEMTPFELYLRIPDADLSLHLIGNTFGELRIEELDDDPETETLQK